MNSAEFRIVSFTVHIRPNSQKQPFGTALAITSKFSKAVENCNKSYTAEKTASNSYKDPAEVVWMTTPAPQSRSKQRFAGYSWYHVIFCSKTFQHTCINNTFSCFTFISCTTTPFSLPVVICQIESTLDIYLSITTYCTLKSILYVL